MMALLMVAKHTEHSDIPLALLSQQVIYQISQNLVPDAEKIRFEQAFKPKYFAQGVYPPPAQFTLTAAIEEIYHHLQDWLQLRELRSEPSANPSQQYGGLGGIIIEGEPGHGKSELVIAALRARDYQEAPTTSSKCFYRIAVSMDAEKKEAMLRQAFDEGAVLIIDEINASGMMERLLNALLMGKTPEGHVPSKPGFMVIGTQNPSTYAGRQRPSTALARRLTKFEYPNYTKDDLLYILSEKGLGLPHLDAYLDVFLAAVAEANSAHYHPLPSVRDLFKTLAHISAGRSTQHPLVSECSQGLRFGPS